MKPNRLLYLVILAGVLIVKKVFTIDVQESVMDQVLYCAPFFFCHTLWIQSSIGYNIMPGRKTNFFFGWGHHLPVHDPVFSLGKQWVKEYMVYEPDGNVLCESINKDQGGFVSIPYECEKEGTYRLAAHIPTGYYSIYKSKKDGKWHHLTDPLDTMENPDETVEKMLISLKYWEWTKAIMTVGKPDGKGWIFAYIASLTFQVDPEWGIKNPSYNL